MKVLHINAGQENGGGLFHIVNLLTAAKRSDQDFELLCLSDGPVAQAARARNLPVTVLGAKSRYDLLALSKLRKFINDGGYDIIHTHGARANLFVDLIHHQLSVPWVITVHSDPLQDFAGRGKLGQIFTKLNVRALHDADRVLAITERFRQQLIEQVGLIPNKLRVIYNGIDFCPDEEVPAKYAHPGFNLLNVARMEPVKNLSLLLKAVADLDQPELHLHLVGDGSQKAELQALARDLGISEQVNFHGFLSHADIKELDRKMDGFVLASKSESFPLVLLEASDQLLPLVSTKVGDMDQMIPDAQHGFTAEVDDLASLEMALKQLLSLSPAQRQEMATIEKAYLAENFSLDKQLATIIEDYEELGVGKNAEAK
jgi:glycosyltransferase involved in cell wall biosynthesis